LGNVPVVASELRQEKFLLRRLAVFLERPDVSRIGSADARLFAELVGQVPCFDRFALREDDEPFLDVEAEEQVFPESEEFLPVGRRELDRLLIKLS